MVRGPRETRYWNDVDHCESCGRSNAMNPIRLGKTQVMWMFRLVDEWGGEANHETMRLEGSDYSTCSWPTYWGLVDKPEGAGTFRMTDLGYAFLAGQYKIDSILWMFDGEIRDREGPKVGVEDILGRGYETYEEIVSWILSNRRVAPPEVLADNRQKRRPQRPRKREVVEKAEKPHRANPQPRPFKSPDPSKAPKSSRRGVSKAQSSSRRATSTPEQRARQLAKSMAEASEGADRRWKGRRPRSTSIT